MPTYRCDYCGELVSGFEGERGVFVAQCQHCGQGYGDRETDEELRYAYDKAHEEEKWDDWEIKNGPYSLYIYIPWKNRQTGKICKVTSDHYVKDFARRKEAYEWLDAHPDVWSSARIYARDDNRRWEDSGEWISSDNKDKDAQYEIVMNFWKSVGFYDAEGEELLRIWHKALGVEA